MTNNDMAMTGNATNMSVGAPPPGEMSATPNDATGYLAKAGAGDLFEIESSRAILAKNPDKPVADFANMMVDAHGQSTAKLKAAAEKAGLTVTPPALDANQQAKLDAIKAAEGTAATTTYLTAQREAHAAALALHQGYAANGDTPALKAAAGEIAPVVQKHIDMLAKMPGA
ncbi:MULTISPECIES: DUF4142 domain-containing protein [unclassified Sphingobium]|uniref:DUF4142 domain-containing protein n=1 Tax=unclassified Sphingobium TaxID=2611147 RepID=UPI0022254828|nr:MULTISPECIES: DUF4142 domain-containing protein [unclassified Sphingobium]MCW2394625.1 putative membrane protein [Sphingobium sp. B8D3B]MCW2418139.1 putative membrane protein [Sphingobium sp. B8D3C]